MTEDISSDRNGDATKTLDVILIGAGLGGLTCAIELARQGLKVCVLEQHRVAGGYAHGFRRKGYYFDVSLHFSGGLDPGCTTHGILESLGVLDKLRLVRANDVFSAEYPDLTFAWPNDPAAARDKLVDLFEAEKEGIDALFRLLPRIKEDVIGPLMIPDFARTAVPGEEGLQAKYSQQTFSQILDQHISDPTLKAIFGQMWGYVGLPPSRSAAMYSTCVFSAVCLEGSYQIVGGSAALARALVARLRELGGDCLVKTPVKRIVVEEGEVSGVETEGGEFFKAPIVISSASPHQTFGKMISGDELSRVFRYRLDKMEASLSMYSMYMGLDCAPSSLGIEPGNHFVNYGVDKDDAYQAVIDGNLEATEWCMTNNEGIDDALHPPGCGIVSALELAPPGDWLEMDDKVYEKRKEEVRQRLLAKYEQRYPGLSDHIVVCELGTPRTMARFTRSHQGAVYGLAQTVEQSSGKRLRNRTPIHGLFLTGAWTWAGGGYEGAMMSGIQTAGAVMGEGLFEAGAPRVRLHPDQQPPVAPEKEGPAATAISHDLDPETEDKHYRFKFPIRVYGDDLNSRGHVDASSLVRYMDRARTEAIEEICTGLGEESWQDLFQITVYRVDARCATVVGLADELEVRTGLRRISTHRASFDQRIVNRATGALVVDAGVEVLFLNDDKKLAPVPEGLVGCDCDLHEFLSGKPEPPPFSDADKFPFRTRFRVYFEDTDLQKITYHVSYVRFCERALFDMIRTVWPDMKASEWMQKHKSQVAGFDVRYLNSSTLGDRLEVLTGVTGMDEFKITMGQRIILAGTSKVLVDATTDVEFRDAAQQVVKIPKHLVDVTMANLFPNGPPGPGEGK